MQTNSIQRISDNLRQFMTDHGITVRHAAKVSGFSIGTISELRTAQDKRLSYYLSLAEAINMPMHQLFDTQIPPHVSKLIAPLSALSAEQADLLNLFLLSIKK